MAPIGHLGPEIFVDLLYGPYSLGTKLDSRTKFAPLLNKNKLSQYPVQDYPSAALPMTKTIKYRSRLTAVLIHYHVYCSRYAAE